MKKYGKSLVNAVPDESTKLLKVLCTDYKPQRLHEREFEHFDFVWSTQNQTNNVGQLEPGPSS